MAEFEVEHSIEDVKEPVPLPEGDYAFRLAKPPHKEPNKAMEENPSSEKAGFNLVLELETFGEADPDFNGRPFTVWISLVKPGDEMRKTRRGGTIADFKSLQLQKAVEALGGTYAGRNISIPDTGLCKAHVVQKLPTDGSSSVPYNEITGDLKPYEVG